MRGRERERLERVRKREIYWRERAIRYNRMYHRDISPPSPLSMVTTSLYYPTGNERREDTEEGKRRSLESLSL